jgi:hypothetical protein
MIVCLGAAPSHCQKVCKRDEIWVFRQLDDLKALNLKFHVSGTKVQFLNYSIKIILYSFLNCIFFSGVQALCIPYTKKYKVFLLFPFVPTTGIIIEIKKSRQKWVIY